MEASIVFKTKFQFWSRKIWILWHSIAILAASTCTRTFGIQKSAKNWRFWRNLKTGMICLHLLSSKTICTVSGDVPGHIGRHISKVIFQFLSLPGSTASAQVTGGRMNRGAGDELEIPIKMKLVGHKKYFEWINKKIKALDNEINYAVKKFMK